jgi:hypothetical protein
VSRKNFFAEDINKKLIENKIEELQEEFAWEHILGNDLVEIITKEGKLEMIVNKLGKNPQKLLYLRWRTPKDWNEVESCINEFNSNDSDNDYRALEIALEKKPSSLSHFYALGVLKTIEFNETLFAYLWDRLGGGSTEAYINNLRDLMREKFVLREPNIEGKLRITPEVHMRLNKLSQKYFGKNNKIIYYLISQYYLKQFTDPKGSQIDLYLLEQYVHHALTYGSLGIFESTYLYVFDGGILEKAHNEGLSAELKPTILLFNAFIDDLYSNLSESQKKKYREPAIKIKIELGRIYADLSKYSDCTKYMDEAQKFLDMAYNEDLLENVKRDLQIKIWHFSGISTSCLGDSSNCIRYYSSIIEKINTKVNYLELLSLGYLAHELMYCDIKQAEVFGELALKKSLETNNYDIIRKNRCNCGQILFYLGKTDDALKQFSAADLDLTPTYRTEVDKRESRRVALQLALVNIKNRSWEKATTYLNSLEENFGDRRRTAAAIAYKGIMLFQMGLKSEGKNKLLEAIRLHFEISDRRHFVMEILSYIWMVDNKFSGDLRTINLDNEEFNGCEGFKESYYPTLNEDSSSNFIEFWKNHFKTNVLS